MIAESTLGYRKADRVGLTYIANAFGFAMVRLSARKLWE